MIYKTIFCSECFSENPKSALICGSCGTLLSPSIDLEKKAIRMRHFSQFFMDHYCIQATGKGITVEKIDIKKGEVFYNFGRPGFSLGSLSFSLLNPPHLVRYLISLFRPQLWKARFHILGFPVDIRDNIGISHPAILDDYRNQASEYQHFFQNNESTLRKGQRFRFQNAWTRFFVVMFLIIILVAVVTFLAQYSIGSRI